MPSSDSPRPEVSLEFPREWVEFSDPADAEHVIRADLTWLLSRWTCIFGRGCHGTVEGQGDAGCCNHGAFFSDKADAKRVRRFADELTPGEWQHYELAHQEAGRNGRLAITVKEELDNTLTSKTRTVDGACIFANRDGFGAGAGCALHALALRTGRNPVETKPEVCWQLPVRRAQDWVERPDGTKVLESTITEFDRRGWGEGGHDLYWYCSSSPEAHVASQPLYRSYHAELTALIGVEAYTELVRLCDKRAELGLVAVHPATAAARLAQDSATADQLTSSTPEGGQIGRETGRTRVQDVRGDLEDGAAQGEIESAARLAQDSNL